MSLNLRRNLRPLSAHIGMAVSAYAQTMRHDMPPETMQTMLRGIQAYYNHPYATAMPPLETIWQSGTVSLKSSGALDQRPALLLVPSLINGAHIFDLMPERSMLRWLSAQGIDSYLLDWGDITQDPAQETVEDLILHRLAPAIEFLSEKNKAPVHVLGYCMGGTLLAAASIFAPAAIASLIFLAAPWDFHVGTQALKSRVEFWAPTLLPLISEKKALPLDWIQMLFASLDPLGTAEKFAKFASMDPDSPQARMFIAVEDWLNDGIDLPAAVAEECMQDWFLQNKPGSGTWEVGGSIIQPHNIKQPALIISSAQDRLVEYDSAAALHTQIPGSALINPACGHIGMIAGSNAIGKVWQPIADWVRR